MMDDTASALRDHAERIRNLETLEMPFGASTNSEFILGRTTVDTDLPLSIPVPRYAYHPDALPAAPNAADNEGAATFGTAWVNQGTSTLTASQSHNVIYVPTTHADIVLRVQNIPATPYTFTAKCRLVAGPFDFSSAGTAMYESSTGKIIYYRIVHSAFYNGLALAVEYYTNFSTYSSTPFVCRWQETLCYMRIADDGANLVFSLSPDGYEYVEAKTLVRNAFLLTGPNQLGIACTSSGLTDAKACFDWIRFT